MNVSASLVSNGQPSEAVEPCERPLDGPSVNTQFLLRLDASSCNTRCDPSHSAGCSTLPEVVALVLMKLLRPLSRPSSPAAPHGRAPQGPFRWVAGLEIADGGPARCPGAFLAQAGARSHLIHRSINFTLSWKF